MGSSLAFQLLDTTQLPTSPDQAPDPTAASTYAHWGAYFYSSGLYVTIGQDCLIADRHRYLDFTGDGSSYDDLADEAKYTVPSRGSRHVGGWSSLDCSAAQQAVCEFPASHFTCAPPPSPELPFAHAATTGRRVRPAAAAAAVPAR